MKSSEYLMRAINKKKMRPSEFSRFIGISESAMSRNLKDLRSMDNYTCIQVAEILEIDPMMLIALTNSERENDEEKKEFFNERVKEYGYVSFSFALFLNFCVGIFYILC